ncbi:hypothetical protein BDY21DRAFT_213585 [Lineolata rhizophorae]|uniref:Uncharacterized protein n=1 Tax=Lineolata rhizophorae TaxID=578093 RepID=A0A6A6P253_9PEZI|nr:hypothetical protein BDY21DRAFT_213585 [Lineolata rhizophorae]
MDGWDSMTPSLRAPVTSRLDGSRSPLLKQLIVLSSRKPGRRKLGPSSGVARRKPERSIRRRGVIIVILHQCTTLRSTQLRQSNLPIRHRYSARQLTRKESQFRLHLLSIISPDEDRACRNSRARQPRSMRGFPSSSARRPLLLLPACPR